MNSSKYIKEHTLRRSCGQVEFGDLAEGKKHGEHECRQHGGDGKRKRYAGGLEQRRHPADDLLNGVHGDILSDINGARDLKTGPPAEFSFYVIALMRPSL